MMKRHYIAAILLTAPFVMGASIPNFFSGLIGKNVKEYCSKPTAAQQELMQSVNLYTDAHKVVIVCSEKVAKVDPQDKPARSARFAR